MLSGSYCILGSYYYIVILIIGNVFYIYRLSLNMALFMLYISCFIFLVKIKIALEV